MRGVVFMDMVIRILKFFARRLSLAVRRTTAFLLCAFAIQVGMVSTVHAVYYTISDLGPSSTITDINSNNQFVGSTFVNSTSHATSWQDGVTLDLDILGD